jgi:hypothetical protein
MNRMLLTLIAAVAVVASLSAARASVVVFDVNGTLDPWLGGGSFSGTLSIDVTTGNITHADVVLRQTDHFELWNDFPIGYQNLIQLYGVASYQLNIVVNAPNGVFGSLVGFNGSPIVQGSLRDPYSGAHDDIVSGSVTPEVVVAVPEPSTWAMMILGFCGLGFMAYRRKSKPALMAA